MGIQGGSTAFIIWRDKILLFKRDNILSIPYPDCWQLPGGIIEEGETPKEALVRELEEEVCCVPKDLRFVRDFKGEDNRTTYLYASFVDDQEAGKFKLGEEEGQEIGFFTLEEALALKLTPKLRKGIVRFKSELARAMKNKLTPDINEY